MAVAEHALDQLRTPKPVGRVEVVWRRFRKHRLAIAGLGMLVFLLLLAFVGPAFSPYDPNVIVAQPNQLPSQGHYFGTDEIGRDVLTRLMWAGRISLLLSVLVTIVASLIGMLVGAIAGYFGGFVDTAAMRFVDFMLSLPPLPLLLVLSAMNLRGGLPLSTPAFVNRFFAWVWAMPDEGVESTLILATILVLLSWMTIARLVRGQILVLRSADFVDAARALGVSPGKIIISHLIPNTLAPIIVTATFSFGVVMINEATLSFLGFGVQPPAPSWGNMLNNVREFMLVQPWRAFVPGMAIFLAALAFNFVGDGLRDALDPRM